MKKVLCASLSVAIFFFACQRNEELGKLAPKDYTVSIIASIGKLTPKSRYSQDNEKTDARFTVKDDIGVFMDDEDAVEWTFDGTSWTTPNSVYWKDKDKVHAFYAYYPYSGSEATDKENIQMPSLNNQDGSWKNIARYDFLVASKSLSYNDDYGNVAFSEENSFQHILSLLKINIKGEGDMAEAIIDKIKLEGNNLITQGHYSFKTNSVTLGETPQETLCIDPSHTVNSQDISFYFILNGTETNEQLIASGTTDNSVNLTIEYTRGNKKYIALREGLSTGLLAGRVYEYNILVKDGNVIITGGSISGWTPGNEVEDIIINGETATLSSK